MKYLKLASGYDMPMVGLGTWTLAGQECTDVVQAALAMGYRHIDTAEGYHNQVDIGKALRAAGIPREELFITSKVAPEHLRYEAGLHACEGTLRDLGTPYVDLYLVHWPNREVPLAETFRALNYLQAEGLVRDIGVSNFTIPLVDQALAASENPIAMNQVEYHPYLNQEALREHCQACGVQLTAYSPFGRGKLFSEPVIMSIAERTGRTPGQVIVQWLMHKGIVAIPRSHAVEHVRANFDVFGWELPAEDFAAIDGIETWQRLVHGPWIDFED
jgi:diketogulonate reductase-like aldo/keto reductase